MRGRPPCSCRACVHSLSVYESNTRLVAVQSCILLVSPRLSPGVVPSPRPQDVSPSVFVLVRPQGSFLATGFNPCAGNGMHFPCTSSHICIPRVPRWFSN
jgi:hypothetical protein